ncbi:hypothetical protein [Streptomyces sp. NPDC046727]|uniref:hypothetical protein n=1 Tax=Streptomyces sp. NPDC046727 TaxID=3155373 RepID=UPI0033FB5EFA
MTHLLTLLHHAGPAIEAAALLYSATVVLSALVAMLAPGSARRRAARDVLALLLRHRVEAGRLRAREAAQMRRTPLTRAQTVDARPPAPSGQDYELEPDDA